MLALSLIVIGVDAGCAQDIAGIEDCTKTSGLDKRTGCLQSNVNFLHRLVIKNALDTRQKPDVAVLPRQLNISAAGVVNTARMIGATLGVAVLGASLQRAPVRTPSIRNRSWRECSRRLSAARSAKFLVR